MSVVTGTLRFRIRNHRGTIKAVHVRQDLADGTKRIWWEQEDGTKGLPKGLSVVDLPLFGSELVKTIPITERLIVVEGEKAALALRAGGIMALATVTGAATVPTPKALAHVAYAAKFVLWPDADEAGVKHMKALAQNLFAAGALEVWIIDYKPTAIEGFARGMDAADIVTPETAIWVTDVLVDDWAVKVRRSSAHKKREQAEKPLITVARQLDTGSVTAALYEAFGVEAQPGRSTRCPMHDDRSASLSVLRDDLRVICHAMCAWAGKGATASEIMEAKR